MAENTLQTRIQLKYDTLENWEQSSIILKSGELAIATVPSELPNTLPAIGLKVGDGTHRFALLPWVQAVASDVYPWAKVSDFQNIPGLYQYVSNIAASYSGGGSGSGSGTVLSYQIVKGTAQTNDAHTYYLKSSSDGTTWTTVSTMDFTDAETTLDILNKWIRGQNYNDSSLDSFAKQVGDLVENRMGGLVNYDTAVTHEFVTAVSQNGGLVTVSRAALDASDIATGELPVTRGGTGANTFASGQVLVGNGTSAVSTLAIDSSVSSNSDNLITSGAVQQYVNDRIGSITGALRMIGTTQEFIAPNSRTNPQIENYDFANARNGDVILMHHTTSAGIATTIEFVWDSTINNNQGGWVQLGDEGSYAVKGSITNGDIAADAAIEQSKIAGLTTALNGKVDKEQGKGLSTNDFDNAAKTKLVGIEDGAEVNTIENINLQVTLDNTTTNTISASVDASNKLATIALDLSNVGQVAGAKVADSQILSGYSDIPLDSTDKKLIFSPIAKTGEVSALTQTDGTILVLQCGDSGVVINNAP